jgi:hypothetical protein
LSAYRPASCSPPTAPRRTKHEAIARAQAEGGIVAGIRPDDACALIVALAGTWSPISATYTASPEENAAEHERRRAVLRDTVRRALVTPGR